jgi:hypothetical protein
MFDSLLTRLRRDSGFVADAKAHGLSVHVARLLEDGAVQVSPDDPSAALDSRELFEQAALNVALADGGGLGLSFKRVDLLAEAIEQLGLTRESDIPDPLRRVWVGTRRDKASRGVALTCENNELAILCMAKDKAILDAGSVLTIGYRGFSSPVEYRLKVSDSCLFPGGLMLHLTREDDADAIGRAQPRFPVQLAGVIRSVDQTRECSGVITDISMGGVRMECSECFAQGTSVSLSIQFPDGTEQPFEVDGEVRWARSGEGSESGLGMQFVGLSIDDVHRLQQFLEEIRPEANGPGLGASSLRTPSSLPELRPGNDDR